MNARIYLTENCNAKCPWCFNKGTRDSNLNMDTQKAKKLFDWFSDNNINHILVMGGEPSVHPDFVELWNYMYDRRLVGTLFTNGINMDLINQVKANSENIIVYNFHTLKPTPDDKYFALPWEAHFEIVIRLDTDIPELLKKISEYMTYEILNHKDFVYTITPDCTIDWRNHKEELADKLSEIVDFANKHRRYRWGFDHSYPRCFFNDRAMEAIRSTGRENNISYCIGQNDCYGLITSDFKLVHCNQFRHNELPIFRNGEIIPLHEMNNFLCFENLYKLHLLRDTCKDCPDFKERCNGGCTMQRFL